MSNFWKIVLLILLNVIVSASVTYGVLYYWENVRNPNNTLRLVTVEQTAESMFSQPTSEDIPNAETPEALEGETRGPEEVILEETISEEPIAEPTPVIRGAKVEISIISSPGVLESETLRIVSNSDEVVSLNGWTLEDAKGNVLTFPNVQLLRKGVFIEVYSRSGHSTPYEIYWNRDSAVWKSGETAVIKDMFGQIQATYRLP